MVLQNCCVYFKSDPVVLQIADLWSCGVILFALVYGDYPFHLNERRFARKIVQGQYSIPENVPVSAECTNLIQQLLVPEPKDRISIEQILTLPWFNVGLPVEAHTMSDWWLQQELDLSEVSNTM